MAAEIVAQVKRDIDRMPPLSPVVHRIVRVANDITSSAQDLTEIIQVDPVLMARVLRMVNSAYFSLGQEVTSLKQAVVMLGINTIKNVALSSTMVQNIQIQSDNVLDPEEFWMHSVAVAVASKKIALRLGVDEKRIEEFFVAGLIHDIGQILINNSFPDKMRRIMDLSAQGRASVADIERRVLGLTHEEVGIAIGKKWNFEQSFLYAVGRHHNPPLKGASASYALVVSVAEQLVLSLGIGQSADGPPVEIPGGVWEVLGITWEIVSEECGDLSDDINRARSILQQ